MTWKAPLYLCILTFLQFAPVVKADPGGTIEVALGKAIPRSVADAKKDEYGYGPKQDYNVGRNETHIYLPYGPEAGAYFEAMNVDLKGPKTDVARVASHDIHRPTSLAIKLHFDQPISQFRFAANWSDWNLGDKIVGGFEYSIDGKVWKTLQEVEGPVKKVIEGFVDPKGNGKIAGLNTQDLYIRLYTRKKEESADGPMWVQLWTAGNPTWGDAAVTFSERQWQLWVVPANKPVAQGAVQAPEATGQPLTPADRAPVAVDDGNPFGVSSSSEWSGVYPRFEPLMQTAGIGWIRYWCEWQGMQPKPGEWKWQWGDDFVSTSRSNGLRVAGVLAYFAPWASSAPDGTKNYVAATRTFPVREAKLWKDYVAGMVGRYRNDVKHWEVWNEVNSPTFNRNGTPEDYADLVRWSHDTAKAIDKDTQIGIGVANFGLAYLDRVIKAGAADHFDYVCVHPYENAESLLTPGGEISFLSLAGNLRRMLAANKQNEDMPLWMTEIGLQAPVKPDAEKDARQAEILTKVYALSIAQGFNRVFWFEARGPAYGKGTDHGLLREDWSPRPAYDALQTLAATLGKQPQYIGWLDLQGSCGFVFRTARGPVMVAWMPLGQSQTLTFSDPVTVIDLAGKSKPVAGNEPLKLTNTPVFVAGLPEPLAQKAEANKSLAFPWGGDYSNQSRVSCKFGSPIDQKGVNLLDRSLVELSQGQQYGTVDGGKKREIHFGVHPTFAPYGTTKLEIKVVARRDQSDQPASFKLRYETLNGRHGYTQSAAWELPADDQWHERTWALDDANFVNTWAYNIAISDLSGKVQVSEISVRKVDAPK